MNVRRATEEDLAWIVSALADDTLGATRDGGFEQHRESYVAAFAAIDADPNQFLAVVEDDGERIATFQASLVPGLTYRGRPRLQVEAVRVVPARQGEGFGARILDWCWDRAAAHGCALVQLTTDRRRPEAQRFYEQQGFQASHVGFKKWFES